MNKKQTGVDYFESELSKLNFDEITNENYWFHVIPIFEKAKQIESVKIVEFTADWSCQWKKHDGVSIIKFYEQTYGE